MNIRKPRGKMSAFGFFVMLCYEAHKQKYPDESVNPTVVLKHCEDKWKTMSDDEKEKCFELAEKDAERYKAEMQVYCEFERKRRRMKDPNAPKRALTPFIFYCKEMREIIRQEHPEYIVTEISRELGKRWRELPDDQRAIYVQKYAEDQLRYDEEMKIYIQSMASPSSIPLQEYQEQHQV